MKQLHQEEWRPIKEYEGIYEISNLANIRSVDRLNSRGYKLKGKPISQHLNYKGYLQVRLCKNNTGFYTFTHKLLAQAFIPNPENKPQVNHINGIKTDNRLQNIEWCTGNENMTHAYKLGLKKRMMGEDNGRAVLSKTMVDLIKRKYNSDKTAVAIANELHITLDRVRYITSKKGWKFTDVDIVKRDDRKTKINQ